MKIFTISLFITLILLPLGRAFVVETPGIRPLMKHDQVLRKREFKVLEGERPKIWQTNQGEHPRIQVPANTQFSFILPEIELSEKQELVTGKWFGFFGVDHFGTSEPGKGDVQVRLLTEENEELANLQAEFPRVLRFDDRETQFQFRRKSVSFSTQKTSEAILGKTLQIVIHNKGTAPAVISLPFLSILNTKPSYKLRERANGAKGPDILNIAPLGINALAEHRERSLYVISIDKGSPADQAGLKKGDLIIGVEQENLPENSLVPGFYWLRYSHEMFFGQKLLAALKKSSNQSLTLRIFRKGKPLSLTCSLKESHAFIRKKGSFTNLNPKTDPAAAAILNDCLQYLVRNQRKDGSWKGRDLVSCLGALALLSTKEERYMISAQRFVNYLLQKYPEAEDYGSLGFWGSSFAAFIYAEYYLATGDKRVLQPLRDIQTWTLTGLHTTKWGFPGLGHGVSGLPYGGKGLIAPTSHIIVWEALAMRCGIPSQIHERVTPYIISSWSDPQKEERGGKGHGAMGYNASAKDLKQFWSRSGLTAISCHLRNHNPRMRDALIKIMHERYPWFRNSHAYGEPGGALGLLALNLIDPKAYQDVMTQLKPWFITAWKPGFGLKYIEPHTGAPYMSGDFILNACYALVLNSPQRTLHLTGSQKKNWWDITSTPISIPPTKVLIKRDPKGLVTLRSLLPGATIRYTLDGSEVTMQSPVYEAPFSHPNYLKIKTMCWGAGEYQSQKSTPQELSLPPAKAMWTVLSASGHKDKNEAIRRASFSIDGSRFTQWISDHNTDQYAPYPHHLTLDFGNKTALNGLYLEFLRKECSPAKWQLSVADQAEGPFKKIAEGDWDQMDPKYQILLPEELNTRFLRLDFPSASLPHSDGRFNSFNLREIDLIIEPSS